MQYENCIGIILAFYRTCARRRGQQALPTDARPTRTRAARAGPLHYPSLKSGTRRRHGTESPADNGGLARRQCGGVIALGLHGRDGGASERLVDFAVVACVAGWEYKVMKRVHADAFAPQIWAAFASPRIGRSFCVGPLGWVQTNFSTTDTNGCIG
jgi:hypothetical protein